MHNTEPHAEVVALLRADDRLLKNNDDMMEDETFYSAIINIGEERDIHEDMNVLIYAFGEELTDPRSGESLGFFEVVRGEGVITQTQAKMSVVSSSRTSKSFRRKPQNALAAFRGTLPQDFEEILVTAPFKGIRVGDLVRFV